MKNYIITKGFGKAEYALNAFDNALLSSGIADYNLVKLSSILPPCCKKVRTIDLPKGELLHVAFSKYILNLPSKTISAAVSIAIPEDRSLPGVIMEASGDYDNAAAENIICSMARSAMKSRGIDKYTIEKETISMETSKGYNCVFAAVAIW